MLGLDLGSLCFGVLYQMFGALDCCCYSISRFLGAERDVDRARTIAYFLDLWALVILGTTSVITMMVLIIYRWRFSDLDDEGFKSRYRLNDEKDCVDLPFGLSLSQ